MEFDETVIKVKGFASYKTRFNSIFYIGKCLYQFKDKTVVIPSFDVFEL